MDVLRDLLVDFFDTPPWPDATPFTAEAVALAATDALAVTGAPRVPEPAEAHAYHLARIAHLLQAWDNDGDDPIDLEVTAEGVLVVEDGCHRICAAITRGERLVFARVSGFLDVGEELLGIPLP